MTRVAKKVEKSWLGLPQSFLSFMNCPELPRAVQLQSQPELPQSCSFTASTRPETTRGSRQQLEIDPRWTYQFNSTSGCFNVDLKLSTFLGFLPFPHRLLATAFALRALQFQCLIATIWKSCLTIIITALDKGAGTAHYLENYFKFYVRQYFWYIVLSRPHFRVSLH